jgi:RNA polymerase sigma factor (sigma-70 family)
MDTSALDPADLLAADGFARSVARGLLFDASRADDAAQDAWLTTLRAAAPPRSLRGFMAHVAARAASTLARGEGRRARREAAAARPERVASTAELWQRETLRRRVVDAVLALDEPYRSAVVLRHFEDLSPAEAARRLGVPTETLRTRLKRALAKLRAELDAEFGSREGWATALLPIAGFKDAAAAVAFGAGGVAKMTIWGSLTAAACAVFVAVRTGSGEVGAAPHGATGGAASVRTAAPPPESAPERSFRVASTPFRDVGEQDGAASAALETTVVVVDVRDGDGVRVPVSALVLRKGDAYVDGRGAGEVGVSTFAPEAGARGEIFGATSGGVLFRAEVALDVGRRLVRVAGGVAVRGKLAVDGDPPLGGCDCFGPVTGDWFGGEDWPAGVKERLKAHRVLRGSLHVRASEDGTFALRGLAPGATVELLVDERVAVTAVVGGRWSASTRTVTVGPVAADTPPLAISARRTPSVRGRVVDGAGKPLSRVAIGASIKTAGRATAAGMRRTDDEGRYELACSAGDVAATSVALEFQARGLQSRKIELRGPFEGVQSMGDVVLGAPLPRRRVRVVDEAGRPVAGASLAEVALGKAAAIATDVFSSVDATTAPDGVATLDLLGRGPLTAWAPGFGAEAVPDAAVDALTTVVLKAAPRLKCVIDPPPGDGAAALRVRIVAADGADPRARTPYAVAAAAAGRPAAVRVERPTVVRCSADGTATLDRVRPGATLDVALLDGLGDVRATARVVAAAEGESVVRLALAAPGGELRVRLVDARGLPVSGVAVCEHDKDPVGAFRSGVSDVEGRVSFGPATRPARLVVASGDFVGGPVEAVPGAAPTDLVVLRARSALLRLVDAEERTVVPDSVEPAKDGPAAPHARALIRADGVVELSGLPDRPTRWTVRAGGVDRTVEVPPDAETVVRPL